MFKMLDAIIKKNNNNNNNNTNDHTNDNTIEMVSTLSLIGLVGFCEIIFGVDIMDISYDLIDPLNRLLTYINGAAEPFTINFDPEYKKFIEDRDFVHNWMKQLIKRSKKSPKCHSIIKEHFMENIDETVLVEFILSIVLGGHETTARLMLGIIYCLLNNKSIINKLNERPKIIFK